MESEIDIKEYEKNLEIAKSFAEKNGYSTYQMYFYKASENYFVFINIAMGGEPNFTIIENGIPRLIESNNKDHKQEWNELINVEWNK